MASGPRVQEGVVSLSITMVIIGTLALIKNLICLVGCHGDTHNLADKTYINYTKHSYYTAYTLITDQHCSYVQATSLLFKFNSASQTSSLLTQPLPVAMTIKFK